MGYTARERTLLYLLLLLIVDSASGTQSAICVIKPSAVSDERDHDRPSQ